MKKNRVISDTYIRCNFNFLETQSILSAPYGLNPKNIEMKYASGKKKSTLSKAIDLFLFWFKLVKSLEF